jgi:hypothetical protein
MSSCLIFFVGLFLVENVKSYLTGHLQLFALPCHIFLVVKAIIAKTQCILYLFLVFIEILLYSTPSVPNYRLFGLF